MMNRRFVFKSLVATLLCVAWGNSAALVGQEEKKAATNISIKKKWEFSFPNLWTTSTTGIISPNEQLYFRSGVLLDLQTGKELESRKEFVSAIFDDDNEAVFSVISDGRVPSQAGMRKVAGDWVLPFWKADGEVLQAYPASLTRLLVIIRNSKTSRNELVIVGKREEIARVPWPEEGSEGVVRVSPDRKTLALIDIPRAKIEVRSLESGKLLTTADAPWSKLSEMDKLDIYAKSDIAISPDLQLLAFRHPTDRIERLALQPGKVEIVKLASGEQVKQLSAHFGASQFVFLNKNQTLMSCRGAIQIWDLKTGDNLVEKAYRKEARPDQLGFNTDVADLRLLLARRAGAYAEFGQAALTPDGKYLALIELPDQTFEEAMSRKKIDRFKVHIMTMPSFALLHTEKLLDEPPFYLQFSPHSRFLVGEGLEKTTVWEIVGS